MSDFLLRTDRDQATRPAPTVLLDWFAGADGSTIQSKRRFTTGLTPSTAATDFLRFAAAAYCADRLSPRPGTWTRSIGLEFPVRRLASWLAAADQLADALAFLSGDEWRL